MQPAWKGQAYRPPRAGAMKFFLWMDNRIDDQDNPAAQLRRGGTSSIRSSDPSTITG